MVVKKGKSVALHVDPVDPKSIQPNGVDLHIGELFALISEKRDEDSVLSDDRRIATIKKHQELVAFRMNRKRKNYYVLNKDRAYEVRYKETIQIPPDCVGMVIARSSLQRNGVMLAPSFWDAGYIGKGSGTLFPMTGIIIHKNFAVGQLVLFEAETPENLYKGQYQHEGLNQRKLLEYIT